MTIVFDTFELERNIELSGSMTSEYVVGNSTLTSSIITGSSIYNTARLVLGDKTTGVSSSIYNSVVKWRYHDFVQIVSGGLVKGSNRFQFCNNSDIIYFDSAMPNMAKIATINNDFASAPPIGYIGDSDLNATAITHNDAADIFISASSPWPTSFPFQSKYRQVARQLVQNRQLGYVTGSLSGSIIGGLHFISVASATLPSWYNTYWFEATCSSNPMVSFSLTNVFTAISTSIVTNNLVAVRFELIKKAFFGIGDGGDVTISGSRISLPSFHQMPRFDVYLYSSQSNSNNIYLIANPQFRGFKYGVLNANPINPKYIFKRNHFGQMGDLLQSPFFSATIASDNITIDYPVIVSFVSGTGVFASASIYSQASSSTSFNPRDNGQYDTYARSGQPYFDIDAVD